MKNDPNKQRQGQAPDEFNSPRVYQIKLRGKLDESWSDWFSGMTVVVEEPGDAAQITYLTGSVSDQANLRGILNRIWDLNLELISLVPVEMLDE